MAELLIRAGFQDASMLPRVLGAEGDGLPRVRVVVDAHVAARRPEFAMAANVAGAPLLVDPQTYLLQDHQPSGDPWCRLPFGIPGKLEPRDMTTTRIDQLIESVAQFQLEHGATAIIPPYFFLAGREVGWADAQVAVWSRTRRVLQTMGVQLPVLAIASLDWKRLRGAGVLSRGEALDRALRGLAPAEVALSSSKSHLGTRPDERVMDLCAAIVRVTEIAPVIAWQQGLLGEACVIAGAVGYETGIGQREGLDMGSALSSRRAAPEDGPRGARPVFVRGLMRSIPKRSVEALSGMPQLWASIFCVDADCCAPSGQTMLRDARAHAVLSRRKSLADLTSVRQQAWRWGALADKSALGLQLAERINRARSTSADISRVDATALRGMNLVASGLRRGSGEIQTA